MDPGSRSGSEASSAPAGLATTLRLLRRFGERHAELVSDTDALRRKEAQDYANEMARIAAASAVAAAALPPSATIPSFYLKRRNAAANAVLERLRSAAKTYDLSLRFAEIDTFDARTQAIFKALSLDQQRGAISLAEFLAAMDEVSAWADADAAAAAAPSLPPLPARSSLITGPGAPLLPLPPPGGSGGHQHQPLNQMLSVPTTSVELTTRLFVDCPRNPTGRVDVRLLLQRFTKLVSLYKCEAELCMCDADCDGRITETEMDVYVRDLIPTVAPVSKLGERSIPFYCCSVTRRIFWTLDPCGRGTVRIDELLRSAVLDEWLELQMLQEDHPRNWFGLTISSQLYEKFLVLDTRGKGMLSCDNVRQYKKGIPMVTDDGLPPNVSPLSSLFIERAFETMALYDNEFDYSKFVDFVVAVEFLPQCHRPQFFWAIFDIYGEGVLTPMTVNHFFRETHEKLVAAGVEAPAVELVVQEVFDIIATAEPLRITRDEFMRSPQAGLFSTLLIDCLAFWTYENREQR